MKAGVVAFAFGVPETIPPNKRISRIAAQKTLQLGGAPLYTQHDVHAEKGIDVEYTEEQNNNPPSTLRLARNAVQWARSRNLTDLWVVAAQPHLWRCIRDLRHSIQERNAPIWIHICKEIESYPESEWFCLESHQKRTQTKWDWERREQIIRLLPFFLYKRIA